MEIDVERAGGSLYLTCTGRLVRGAHCEWLLAAVENPKTREVVIDCRRVERIDAYGIGLLVAMATQGQSVGIEVTLKNIPRRIAELLGMCGLDGLLRDAAVAGLHRLKLGRIHLPLIKAQYDLGTS